MAGSFGLSGVVTLARPIAHVVWCLERLQKLDMSGCVGLYDLCESFGGLAALEVLDLTNCCGLTSLPASLVQLTRLRVLQVPDHLLSHRPEALAMLAKPQSGRDDGVLHLWL
jgi:hypothetical protein